MGTEAGLEVVVSGGNGHGKLTQVRKRDGQVAEFSIGKISNAITKAMSAVGGIEGNLETDPPRIARNVLIDLEAKMNGNRDYVPGIEDIQNLVERNLILASLPETAKRYIIYRHERSQVRQKEKNVPERVRSLVDESRKYFKTDLGEFIYFRTYSRWKEDEGRRETWIETIDRYVDFMKENLESRISRDDSDEIRNALLNQKVMPSMRLMWSAGNAARSTNVAGYNCSYVAPKKLKDFGEILYVLACGTGVGFSVENQTVQQLPIINRQRGEKKPVYVVQDSKEGWANALVEGMQTWYEGYDVDFDFSKVRPAGAILKTMGGRSSGPAVLEDLLKSTRNKILANQGRRLNSLDVHDIVCKTGEIIVVGGVRRSALISLSDLNDELMRNAKTGEFYRKEPQRQLANNSASYNGKPNSAEFLREWVALAESGTGERGIFNRAGLEQQLPARRWENFGNFYHESGTNPCGEIILRNKQFCNLTEVIVRPGDNMRTLLEKVRIATILGTYQSTLTDFPYLSSDWKENCEEERLLGVSLTGVMDTRFVRDPLVLDQLREHAQEVNIAYAKKFGINPSTCITCVKPSGTVSQLVDASPGMHARHSPFYTRNVRISASDPLFQMMKDQKYPYFPEVGQGIDSATTYVLPFAVKAPEGSIVRRDLSAIKQLEHWQLFKQHYTEHNPSVTIDVGGDEWLETASWLYRNWEKLGGLSFLPRDDHVYKLAPFEEVTEKGYNELVQRLPKIDYANIMFYEGQDQTSGARELACVGGSCAI